MHFADEEKLKGIGLTHGDIIRLKENSLKWWNSTDARKRKDRPLSPTPNNETLPNKKIRFEKRFKDSGSVRVYGPMIVPGDLPPGGDVTWFYFSEACANYVPIPPGFMPILDGKDEENNWFA